MGPGIRNSEMKTKALTMQSSTSIVTSCGTRYSRVGNSDDGDVQYTHVSLASLLSGIANRIAPDETPLNAASHLGLFCLLRGISSKNGIEF